MAKTLEDARKMLIEELKDCGQDLVNRAEDFIGDIDCMTDFSIDIRKSCSNCKFKSLMKRDDPCVYCGYYDRWEPGKMTKGE